MDLDDLGPRLLELLGEPACRELLEVLERPEPERAALIGRLYQRDDGRALAEVLADVETDPEDRGEERAGAPMFGVLEEQRPELRGPTIQEISLNRLLGIVVPVES